MPSFYTLLTIITVIILVFTLSTSYGQVVKSEESRSLKYYS